ncbi:MAG: HAD family phosphatase [Anaerolineaceae bacterium]|nr:MAG: HAD family phosphatase [Anaerolineaceae bacterium]
MIRAILFDFGNVLMYTADHTPRWRWDDALGLARGTVARAVHNDDSWIAAQTGAVTLADYWADVADKLAITPEQTRQLADDFYAGDVLEADLVAAIRRWRESGVRVGLLSNDSAALRPKLAQLGIVDLFDPLVISGEIGVMKPAPAAYRAVLDHWADLSPAGVVFIDDRQDNIDGARAVGMEAVHYPQVNRAPSLIAHLDELVGAEGAELR